ncbi:MAG: 16S rRNA (guanine(527)-N(7))-methyltransferase RsmG [Hellea sp.]|nr:16S rRNA (guanine(527)-N(7))-methyltransferase RsmG [Hellea sp.]
MPDLQPDLTDNPAILQDFKHWQSLLVKWNARINLVSDAAMADFWGRHALDSWQLWDFVPKTAQTMLDLGSGAGFPGIAMAIGCKSRGSGTVVMVESAGKKANFLRTIIRELDLPAKVWADRVEKLTAASFDLITARAFAPLPKLLNYAQPFWGEGTTALLLKGQTAKEELTAAAKLWNYDVESFPSRSDESGVILKLQHLTPKS